LTQTKKQVRQFKNKARKNLHLDHRPSDEMDLLITTMNDGDFGFKLDTCKLQLHHERYGEGQNCEDHEEDTLLQIDTDSDVDSDSDLDSDENSEKKFGSNS
jgi:hypothetical protein